MSTISETAYPLGVVLSREAVKQQQREANKLLASEVEASVLQLAQSDVAGAKNQVQAILGFAERLRDQEVTGRLTVNVLISDPSAPIFLEDGDLVYVPKRPSYVSVIGSVQKETMASYSSNKTFSLKSCRPFFSFNILRILGDKSMKGEIKSNSPLES